MTTELSVSVDAKRSDITITVAEDPFLFQHIRLKDVQTRYRQGRICLTEVPRIYRQWVGQDDALIFECESKLLAVLAPKRGNAPYRERARRSVEGLDDALIELIRIDLKNGRTNALFFTGTYDPKRTSRRKAWENVGSDWNRFLSALRRRYGRVEFTRVWQAHRNGYPHVHAVLVFQDPDFKTFVDSKGTIRIDETPLVQKYWSHGFVDIEVPSSVDKAVEHILRYITRYIIEDPIDESSLAPPSKKGAGGVTQSKELGVIDAKEEWTKFHGKLDLTLALTWFFRKRSFGLSKTVKKMVRIIRLDREHMHNSNTPGLSPGKKYVFLGVSSWSSALQARNTLVKMAPWSFELSRIPDDTILHDRKEGLPAEYAKTPWIARGARMTKPGTLDEWTEDGPVFDELSDKMRRRMNRLNGSLTGYDWSGNNPVQSESV